MLANVNEPLPGVGGADDEPDRPATRSKPNCSLPFLSSTCTAIRTGASTVPGPSAESNGLLSSAATSRILTVRQRSAAIHVATTRPKALREMSWASRAVLRNSASCDDADNTFTATLFAAVPVASTDRLLSVLNCHWAVHATHSKRARMENGLKNLCTIEVQFITEVLAMIAPRINIRKNGGFNLEHRLTSPQPNLSTPASR